MFVVLTKEKRKGLRRLFGGRRKPWEEQDILGTPFAVVPLGKRTNWAKLQKIVGRYASRVVVPPGLKLPNSKIWRAFAGERFEEKLLENTVKSLADGLGLAAERIAVGVADTNAKHQALVEDLLQFFPNVTVYCQERESYQEFSREILEEYGAPLAVTQEPQGLGGCQFILSLEEMPQGAQWGGLLLTTKEMGSKGGRAVEKLRPLWPEEMLEKLPEDIDPMNFFGAMLELGRCHYALSMQGEQGQIEGEPAVWLDIVEEARLLL